MQTASQTEPAPFYVETYLSGHAYKERDFATFEGAKAYQAELHAIGHYFVPIFSGDEAAKARRATQTYRQFKGWDR